MARRTSTPVEQTAPFVSSWLCAFVLEAGRDQETGTVVVPSRGERPLLVSDARRRSVAGAEVGPVMA